MFAICVKENTYLLVMISRKKANVNLEKPITIDVEKNRVLNKIIFDSLQNLLRSLSGKL